MLAYGAVGPRVAAELEEALGSTSVELVDGDLAVVATRAAEVAQPGDVVLLSPACSSFDMFESYEARGRRFSELARGAV